MQDNQNTFTANQNKKNNASEKIISELNPTESQDVLSTQVGSILHEEIFEFDLSDPITEPVAVSEKTEDTYIDDSIIKVSTINIILQNIDAQADSNHLSASSDIVAPITEDIKEEISIEDTIPEALSDKSSLGNSLSETSISDLDNVTMISSLLIEPSTYKEHDNELIVETGEQLQNIEKISDKINQIVIEEFGLEVEIDISREHIILINNTAEFMKHQHTIIDNKCISFFWPSDSSGLVGSRISISTEKDKTFVLDLDKIDIDLLDALLNGKRPIKIFFNAKPIISWCAANNLNLSYIFDITTALNILNSGKSIDNSLDSLIVRFSNVKIEKENFSLNDFVYISKFLLAFRKQLVNCFETLEIMHILNLELKVLFALELSESTGLPYKEIGPNPLSLNIWELIESKYGITSKKELAKAGILSLSKAYLSERKDLLEVREYWSEETSERIKQNFDTKFIQENRIFSTLESDSATNIITKDYSFDGEGLYSFITPDKDSCLVEGKFKDLEIRVIAKLLNNNQFFKAFQTKKGPYGYFAAPLFNKNSDDISLDELFKAKMILETITRNLGERETLFYIWNTYQAFMKVEEIISLKQKFKQVHQALIKLIQETNEKAQKVGYVLTSNGRFSVIKNEAKAFYTHIEMYMNDVFKRALELTYNDLVAYNADYKSKIKLCTIYNRIITLECNKDIVNIAIDLLTRNMSIAASKLLRGIPVLLEVYAAEQWEV